MDHKRSLPFEFDNNDLHQGNAKRKLWSNNDSLDHIPVVDLTADGNDYVTNLPKADQVVLCGICTKSCLAADDTVYCSSGCCSLISFHRGCVGLANKQKYKDTSKWRCLACRTQASSALPGSFPPSQTPTSSQNGVAGPAPIVSPAAEYAPEPPLHPEQLAVASCIERGSNVFYTGSGGVGKSTVLKAFVKGLRAQGKQVDIIAPSGIAAIAVGGSTIFSYAGWHPDIFKEGMEKLLAKAMGKNVRRRLCSTDVLVIDEISMVEADMLTRLDTIMRSVRNGYKPERGQKKSKSCHSAKYAFGGVQIIVTGDFCQLPPVKPFQYCITCGGAEMEGWSGKDGAPKKCIRCHKTYEDKDKWAFKSPAWTAAEFEYFELKHIHRQSDVKFISILQKYRYGQKLTPAEKQLLLQKKNIPGAVKLLPQKREVEKINREGLNRLAGTSKHYECLDFYEWRNKEEMDLKDKGKPLYPHREDGPKAALKDHRFEEKIELKLGMRVILLVNLDLGMKLVNGAQGTIVGFEKYDPTMTYVQQPSDAGGRGSKESDEMSELAALKDGQIHTFMDRAAVKEFPVVKFDNGITRVIVAHCQINELGSAKPYSRLGRTQIPLLAAWAITIHKSQGMTLDRVSVDLGNSFEREMAYVALSRARSLEGLEVLRLPRNVDEGMDLQVRRFLQENVWKGENPS